MCHLHIVSKVRFDDGNIICRFLHQVLLLLYCPSILDVDVKGFYFCHSFTMRQIAVFELHLLF